MATLDWHLVRRGRVTLVHLLVRSDCRERVRVTNCLDGPVWAPRRDGEREPGWDREGYTGVTGADTRLLLGYATPGEPREPPAEIVEATRPSDQEEAAEEAVRRLSGPHATDESPRTRSSENTKTLRDSTQSSSSYSSHESLGNTVPPARVADWLSAVEARVENAERLASASSVAEASAAVEAAGGYEAVRTLKVRVETDRKSLDMIGERAHGLQHRLADAEIPVESLGYLGD